MIIAGNDPAGNGSRREVQMIPDRFSTLAHPEPEQFDAWRERFKPVLDVVAQRPDAAGFAAENKVWALGGLALSRVTAPPVRVVRTRTDIRRDSIDHWVLTYCRHGQTAFSTDNAALQARPGVPFLWSLADASLCERSEVERFQMFLTRDAFGNIAPLLDRARGAVLDTPLGHLLGDFMVALERRLPDMTPDEMPGLTRAVSAMVAAAVEPHAERVANAQSQIDLGSMERVRRAVLAHLRAPELEPGTLCRMVGISRSRLYRLFEHKGGVARYIQEQRLLEAHRMLCDLTMTGSIATIAAELCFADASSFSRAFRREFGQSPGDVRAAALAGMVLTPLPRVRAEANIANFGDLLRGF
jgi:AraC-like DNA-binding protein